jgi:hypothetical protein
VLREVSVDDCKISFDIIIFDSGSEFEAAPSFLRSHPDAKVSSQFMKTIVPLLAALPELAGHVLVPVGSFGALSQSKTNFLCGLDIKCLCFQFKSSTLPHASFVVPDCLA